MGELVQPASECPGQVVVPFARGPQGADRSDRLDLTTSEDMMTATELSEWRSAGRGPARRQDVPDLGLGSPTRSLLNTAGKYLAQVNPQSPGKNAGCDGAQLESLCWGGRGREILKALWPA